MNMGSFIAGIIFGIVGVYFLKRGKKETNFYFLGVGLTLIVYTYFVDNVILCWLIGIGLTFLGYAMRFS